jgi:hypothetical protein
MLQRRVPTIRTRQELVAFVRLLAQRGSSISEPQIENPSTRAYLEALAAWVEDTTTDDEPTKDPDWASLAAMLEAALYYE